ncbi:MAG TPA: tRNA preQ1(34) S-adenosylmethionine ribosyltransferase-isomerase QueA [Candidatus Saccharimonadales bacterium]|nr:tRNA preQ1(34) S-adenosylmethionine ribosyltransferase-isomerase QueA [Candidatus Saccharimonadales bacterium]
MKISDYNYILPKSLIADAPPEIRGESRLLVLNRKNGTITDKKYPDITDYLNAGDVLVLNNTKVIKARLEAINKNGLEQEILILEKHSSDNDWHRHSVLYRGKVKEGDELSIGNNKIIIDKVLGGGVATVRCDNNLLKVAAEYGNVPLPPYMQRDANQDDIVRYQTVWAKEEGSVAAPTASLNMTDEILTTILAKGVKIVYVTLHVGLGTFLPIRSDNVEDHDMHQEYFEIPKETVRAVQAAKLASRRVVALGTTVARTLEYSHESLTQTPVDISGEADIFIYPGYRFRVIDGLLTNFHTPKSTVLMLTAAFAGWDRLLTAYTHAISEEYTFFSYGDSMLIL